MESESLYMLTDELWRAIDKIGDTLACASPDAGGLQTALQSSLVTLLTSLKRSEAGAALYLPRFCEHVESDWTFLNPPSGWLPGLENAHPPLYDLVCEVMRTGKPCAGPEAHNIGAVFPVASSQRTYGALLVSGPAIAPEEYPQWAALLRPIGRAAALHATLSGNTNGVPNYRELMGSRNTLRAMFDSLPISIYIIDHTYTLVAINRSRAERAGEKPNQLFGGKCYEKLYQRASPCAGCRVAETFANGHNTARVNRSWIDHERFVEWEINTFPIMDEKDFIAQTIVIEQDVTEKRNLESNLIQSEKLAAVGQLAAGVAHEINNPLTAIIANAQILRREVPYDQDDLMESIKLIEMAGTRASQVVRNLLGIARKEKYEFEPIDLNDTVHNALSLVQHELVGRPIQVYLDMQDPMPQVLASQDQLQGVWINLILNAIDAVDKEAGKISVTTHFNGSEFLISVMDNGKGIAPDHLARVFDPFFTTKVAGRGTGLGLSVCMRVIRHHGGNIVVESRLGEWTRFTVSLPGPK